MFNISNYLKKITDAIGKSKIDEERIISIFSTQSIEIKPNQFTVKNGVLKIDISPIEKNQIFIKKQTLLEELKSLHIIDIR